MLLNRFFRLEMVKGDPNHHPRTLNAPFRAARHPGVQNNKTGSIHVCTPVALNILVTNQMHEFDNRQNLEYNWWHVLFDANRLLIFILTLKP